MPLAVETNARASKNASKEAINAELNEDEWACLREQGMCLTVRFCIINVRFARAEQPLDIITT